MNNCFDYLKWRGDLSFCQDPFNEIDGMILSRFVYAPFDGIVSSSVRERITLGEACVKMLELPNLSQLVLNSEDIRLYETLMNTKRYQELELCNFRNIIDDRTQTQFCAITVKIMDGLYGIVFRGTDNTLVGWKEDFNMMFTHPVPCQQLAAEYVEDTGLRIRGKCILCGHSKGGNIAIYGGVFCNKSLQKRILRIYNYDGPGFPRHVLESKEYGQMLEKIVTYMPQGSIFGMLLEHNELTVLVRSEASNGLLQHNTYTWELEGPYFVDMDERSASSRMVDDTLKEWISQMSIEKREKFVESLYAVISRTNATTLNELGENWMANMRTVSAGVKGLDKDTKEIINEGIRVFKSSAKNAVSNMIHNN